jgi:hypothetical protein
MAVMFMGIVASDVLALSTRGADEAFRSSTIVVAWVVGGMLSGVVTARLAPRRSQIGLSLVGLLLGLEMILLLAGHQTRPLVVVLGFPTALLASIGCGYLVVSRFKV